MLTTQVACLTSLAPFSMPFLEVARQTGLLPGKKLEIALAAEHESGQHTYTLIKFLAFLNLVLFVSSVLGSAS